MAQQKVIFTVLGFLYMRFFLVPGYFFIARLHYTTKYDKEKNLEQENTSYEETTLLITQNSKNNLEPKNASYRENYEYIVNNPSIN